MRSALFAACVAVAVVPAAALAADPVAYGDRLWASPEEAARHAPPPPAECLDASGANACIGIFMGEFHGLQWRFVWATRDTETLCVDRATADLRVDCDAPDAVVHVPPPAICVHSPDGHSGGCGPARDYVYRPTP